MPPAPATSPAVTVIMPSYAQEAFIPRAMRSLLAQSFTDWELICVDDGSPGDTAGALAPYLDDARIRYRRLRENAGLGAALNHGLEQARGIYIAYLPTDDVYYAEHLASLIEALEADSGAILAYSGVRHHYNRIAEGRIPGYPLQLVQVMHRACAERWLTRAELVTDDLGRLFWDRLVQRGRAIGTGRPSCEWVNHPAQRHKLLREPEGGLNRYRARFQVTHPLRFQSSIGNLIDEEKHYRPLRERPPHPPSPDGLKILLVGELAYNPERVLALEERGHRLYGLWMRDPHWYNTVGPLPFGRVEDLPYENWAEAVRRLRPDLIYAGLNWQAVPFAHEVLRGNPGIPFLWHFKEGPFICIERGSWEQLVDLYTKSDGQIYVNPEMHDWFETLLPVAPDRERTLILDGDLPKREWFTDERSPRLSELDGEVHVVVPGRPIGVHPWVMEAFARERLHLHFYGDYTHGQWKEWIEECRRRSPGYLHLHPQTDQEDWVREFSRYDAGLLHLFESGNHGEIRRANWDDLNYPARISTLAAAGLPMIQRANTGHIVATQALAEPLGISLFFRSFEELGAKLYDRAGVAHLRENVWRERMAFTFDHHADRLVGFFRKILRGRS